MWTAHLQSKLQEFALDLLWGPTAPTRAGGLDDGKGCSIGRIDRLSAGLIKLLNYVLEVVPKDGILPRREDLLELHNQSVKVGLLLGCCFCD